MPLERFLGRRLADRARRVWRGRTHPLYLREFLAARYLAGAGIEIGGLHHPLRVPSRARVRYLDRFDTPGLRRQYPDLAGERLVNVDIVDDGERLDAVDDGSLDFVIANHFLEHAQNVYGVLARFLAVLRPGGVLFLSVPDRDGTFDRDRPLTTTEHLLRDFADGPEWGYRDHVREFVRLAQKFPEDGVEAQVENIARSGYSIHYHVWTHDSLCETLFEGRRRLSLPFEAEALVRNRGLSESVCVLRRRPGAAVCPAVFTRHAA
ncbi:MAG: methyltransferase domain-containing protein [Gemmataceae bacterium]